MVRSALIAGWPPWLRRDRRFTARPTARASISAASNAASNSRSRSEPFSSALQNPIVQVARRAVFMLTASKKGVSALIRHHPACSASATSPTWFMMHRLREALRTGGLAPMGGHRLCRGGGRDHYRSPAATRSQGASTRFPSPMHKEPSPDPCPARWISPSASILTARPLARLPRSCARTSSAKTNFMTDEGTAV